VLDELVPVYAYRCDDSEGSAGGRVMPRRATVDALLLLRDCTPLEGSAELVPASLVDDDGFYWP
jgi:hypothetical protein